MPITDLTIRTYDEYLVKKIEQVIGKDKVTNKPFIDVIYSPYDLIFTEAVKRQQVGSSREIRFPLIACHRSTGFTISEITHRVSGPDKTPYYVAYVDENNQRITRKVQVINVDIPYSIEILTKDENQAFSLVQELLFLFLREPFVKVPKYSELSTIPAIEKTNFTFVLTMDNDIADNTDLEAESDIGKIYRLTLSLLINDAALTRDVTEYLVNTIDVNIDAE